PSTSPRDWRDGAAAELLRATFLHGYERATGRPIAYERLAVYEAAMLATRALSFAWGQQGDWQLRASALLDLALERLVSPEPTADAPRHRRPRRRRPVLTEC